MFTVCAIHIVIVIFLTYSYADTLMTIKLEVSSQGQQYLSWNDIQNCIDMVNMQVQEENDSKYLVGFGFETSPIRVVLTCVSSSTWHFFSMGKPIQAAETLSTTDQQIAICYRYVKSSDRGDDHAH